MTVHTVLTWLLAEARADLADRNETHVEREVH